MIPQILVCCLFYLAVLGAAAVPGSIRTLRERSAKGPIIFSTQQEVERYVLHSERPAHLLVLVTISEEHPRYATCSQCISAAQQFTELWKLWKVSMQSTDTANTAVFPAILHLERMPDVARMFPITQLPAIVAVPSSKSGVPPQPYSKESMELYEIVDFAKEHFGQAAAAQVSRPLLTREQIRTLALYAALGASGVLALYLLVWHWRSPMLWFAVSLLVYFVSMSGAIWNAINYAPFSGRPGDGIHQFISPQGMRSQYRVEGYIVAILVLLFTILYVFISDFVPRIQSGLWRRVSFLIVAAGFYGLYLISTEIHKVKFAGFF